MALSASPNLLQKLSRKISGTDFGAKLASVLMHRVDRPVLNATKGRFAPSAMLTGLPVAIVTTTGAKSGRARSIPLVAIPDGDKVILIASNWGGTAYPAWYHNLKANPMATVNLGGETRGYRAHEAVGDEYARYWEKAVGVYAGYEGYKTRTGGRPIPIMVLQRV